MRIIAFSTLRAFVGDHPQVQPALLRWHRTIKSLDFGSLSDVQAIFPKAKVPNGDRVRFEVASGQNRPIAAVDFEKRIVFVTFLGTHRQCDAVDALNRLAILAIEICRLSRIFAF